MRSLVLFVVALSQVASADVTVPVPVSGGRLLCSVRQTYCVNESCRWTQITIALDGKTTIDEGEDKFEPERRKTRLSSKQLARIRAAFKRARFFSLEPDYPVSVEPDAETKSGSAVIVFHDRGRSKTVSFGVSPSYTNESGVFMTAPARLGALAEELSDLVRAELGPNPE